MEKHEKVISEAENKKYVDSVHRIGRIGSIISILIMVGIPVAVCAYYRDMPSFGLIMQVGGPLIATFFPLAIGEVLAMAPMLGTASYITFITGEVMNIKVPVAINALEVAKVQPSTDEGDAIVTIAICVSSLFAMVIMIFGVLLLVPLQPIFELASVKTASSYILPALFGWLGLSVILSSTGKYTIKKKPLMIIPAVVITFIFVIVCNALNTPPTNWRGFLLIVMIVLTIYTARVLYKKGIIQVFEKGNSEPLPIVEKKKKVQNNSPSIRP